MKKDIQNLLDQKGIKYNQKDTIAQLYEKLNQYQIGFKELLLTHNTPLTTLYQMMKGEYKREIRCCDDKGVPVGLGAQFRYGLDSQYGDVLFIMKPEWWKYVKGVDIRNIRITRRPYIGRIFRKDLIEYIGDNKEIINKRLRKEAREYNFRPTGIVGDGTECLKDDWVFSWCNSQFHVGEAVKFDKVYRVLVPRWVINDKQAINKMEKIDIENLQKLVMNQMPYFPDGRKNLLNGKFMLYGPSKIGKAYGYFFENSFYEIKDIYAGVGDIKKYQKPTSTSRLKTKLGGSSVIAISENAFKEAESIYMKLLRSYGY
jgi:hypothetical protein